MLCLILYTLHLGAIRCLVLVSKIFVVNCVTFTVTVLFCISMGVTTPTYSITPTAWWILCTDTPALCTKFGKFFCSRSPDINKFPAYFSIFWQISCIYTEAICTKNLDILLLRFSRNLFLHVHFSNRLHFGECCVLIRLRCFTL